MKDMTQGNPVKEVLLFSVPMILASVFQQMYNAVDSIIVGQFVGANALAAVGAAFPAMFLAMSVLIGITMGVQIIISQLFGAGEHERMRATFATSIIAKPIKYGADLVIYSATKYLGGHDDLVGGAVVGSEEIIKSLSFYLGLYGANLGATESWLLARSLRTLPLRVKKMAENGLALAKFFESHPKVEKVYYPGLESSPSKALADKQFEGNGYGGMLCVNFKGGQKEIDKLISNLQLVRFVPTLAGVGTTLTYPPRASHRDLSPDELAAIGITMGQIRLSSGLEDTDDLLNDFDQALAKM